MNTELTELVFILDRSGSMGGSGKTIVGERCVDISKWYHDFSVFGFPFTWYIQVVGYYLDEC